MQKVIVDDIYGVLAVPMLVNQAVHTDRGTEDICMLSDSVSLLQMQKHNTIDQA